MPGSRNIRPRTSSRAGIRPPERNSATTIGLTCTRPIFTSRRAGPFCAWWISDCSLESQLVSARCCMFLFAPPAQHHPADGRNSFLELFVGHQIGRQRNLFFDNVREAFTFRHLPAFKD